jgi:hypothetical protein
MYEPTNEQTDNRPTVNVPCGQIPLDFYPCLWITKVNFVVAMNNRRSPVAVQHGTWTQVGRSMIKLMSRQFAVERPLSSAEEIFDEADVYVCT